MYKNFKVLLIGLFALLSNQVWSQCAMCKAVVENGDISMAEGVNNGITYLMIFPYVLVGILFFALYRYRVKYKN